MKLVKVLSVDDSKIDKQDPYSVLRLIVDFGNGVPLVVEKTRNQYRAFMIEQKLLELGVSGDIIEEYGSLKYEEGYEDGYESF